MGVTLERVQFKFASIIGELCSEPDILSQFAVWVDLRLAEYKLKGSISLDCSGDTPDPVWLKGILSALLAKRLAKKREQSKPLGHSFGSGSPSSDVNYSRMRSRQSLPSHTESLHADESVVSVKDEPFDDVVYPVGLHAHEISRSPRKRSAAESLRGEDDGEQADIMYAHSMPKQSRSDNQTNESLMSIIGGENRQENNATSHSGFEQITETIDLIVDSEERGNSSLDATDMPSSFPLLDASNDNNFSSLTTGSRALNQTPSFDTSDVSGLSRSIWIPDINNDPQTKATSRKTRSDLNIFHGWLQSRPDFKLRPIEQIPPDELDGILAEMYATLRPKQSGEYDPKSLKSVRNSIERHLRDQGYPVSTVSSETFVASQEAYRRRIEELTNCPLLNRHELLSVRDAVFLQHNPNNDVLLACLFWLNSYYFPDVLKNKIDHFNLLWGDIELISKPDGRESLCLTAASSMKIKARSSVLLPSRFEAFADKENQICCPIRLYKLFLSRRPKRCLDSEIKYYLQPATESQTFTTAGLSMRMVTAMFKSLKQQAITLACIPGSLDQSTDVGGATGVDRPEALNEYSDAISHDEDLP